jgi:SAM-dependent methyltransferase
MNQSVSEKINNLGPKTLNALEVSGTDNSKFNWNSYVNYMYPDFDLINPGKISERFDIVICEQVLEHVTNPFKAAETLYDLLELGGTVIVSTPFLIKLHGMPQDYWRFTPSAIRLILESAGFSQIEVHTWGNRRSVIGNLGWWQGYRF